MAGHMVGHLKPCANEDMNVYVSQRMVGSEHGSKRGDMVQ